MVQALNEARECKVDVPVGVVIVKEGKVIAKAHNQKEKRQDATSHAEILAIAKASKKVKNFILEDCQMYVTLEPCMMCYGAIASARIRNVYFGAYNKKYPTVEVCSKLPFNHYPTFVGGIREEECSQLIQEFFSKVRKRNGRDTNTNKESRI